MVCWPSSSAVVKLALPPARGTGLPKVVPSTTNCTAPVGMPGPAVGVTVAVKVVWSPQLAPLGALEVRLRVVGVSVAAWAVSTMLLLLKAAWKAALAVCARYTGAKLPLEPPVVATVKLSAAAGL